MSHADRQAEALFMSPAPIFEQKSGQEKPQPVRARAVRCGNRRGDVNAQLLFPNPFLTPAGLRFERGRAGDSAAQSFRRRRQQPRAIDAIATVQTLRYVGNARFLKIRSMPRRKAGKEVSSIKKRFVSGGRHFHPR